MELVRELERPITHLALDKPPHAAALTTGAVMVHTAKGWREEPLPPQVRDAEGLVLSVFFGRDYRVRVVGTLQGKSGVESVYLRALPGGLRPAPDEIGQLGGTRSGALIAVLGTADPELVCRPSAICLVKRLSGWARLPAPPDLTHVAIADEKGFAIAGKQLLRAEREWVPVGPPGPWEALGGSFVVGESVFALEPGTRMLHELRGDRWHSTPSPVGVPRALWGAAADALWIVGDEGIAHFDGRAWRPVAGAPTQVHAVLGRSRDDVWFGGASGLYRLASGATR